MRLPTVFVKQLLFVLKGKANRNRASSSSEYNA